MAIQAILYQMVKDQNSTRRPAGTGNPYMVELKDACSVVNPTLIFNFGQQDFPSGFNYVVLPTFENRCYWVDNWVYYRGLWQCSCHVDALASWRGDIGASTQFVVRAQADFDGRVVDGAYPLLADTFIEDRPIENPLKAVFGKEGAYVVGIINAATDGLGGGLTYYSMTQAQFQSFRAYLLGSSDYLGITDISDQLSKALFNPIQYVVSCVWFPFAPPTSGTVDSVPFGWWSAPVSASLVENSWSTVSLPEIPLPDHPQVSRGKYVNLSPATRRDLFIPPFGQIPLDTAQLADYSAITGYITVDFITGDAMLALTAVDNPANVQLLIRYANVGVKVPLANISFDSSGGISGVLTRAALGAGAQGLSGFFNWVSSPTDSGNLALPDNPGPVVTEILSSAVAANSDTEVHGQAGSSINYTGSNWRLVSYFTLYSDDAPQRRGRPLCQFRQISTLPGYIQCAAPHIECHATASEIRQIEAAMASGFFWE